MGDLVGDIDLTFILSSGIVLYKNLGDINGGLDIGEGVVKYLEKFPVY
jgi:hypothetical protein